MSGTPKKPKRQVTRGLREKVLSLILVELNTDCSLIDVIALENDLARILASALKGAIRIV